MEEPSYGLSPDHNRQIWNLHARLADGHYRCSKRRPTCKHCRLRETACIYTSRPNRSTEPQRSCKAYHDSGQSSSVPCNEEQPTCGSCDTCDLACVDDQIEQRHPAVRIVFACTSDRSTPLTDFTAPARRRTAAKERAGVDGFKAFATFTQTVEVNKERRLVCAASDGCTVLFR